MFMLEHFLFFPRKIPFHYKTNDIVLYIHACKQLLNHVGAISGHGEVTTSRSQHTIQNNTKMKIKNNRGRGRDAIHAIHAIHATIRATIRAKIGGGFGGAGPKRYPR